MKLRWHHGRRMLALLFIAVQATATGVNSSNPGDWWTVEPFRSGTIKRSILPEDMIRYVSIGDPRELGWMNNPEVASFSPDGAKVAVVLQRGNPELLTNEAALLIFDTKRLLSDPLPTVLARFASTTNYRPISKIEWLDDDRLIFAGTQGEARTQIYRADLRSGRIAALTVEMEQIESYELIRATNQLLVILKTSREPRLTERPECRERGCEITTSKLEDLVHGRKPWDRLGLNAALYDLASAVRKPIARPAAADAAVYFCRDHIIGSVSPDGRMAIHPCLLSRGPDWWGDYTAASGMRERAKAGMFVLSLLDLGSGRSKLLTGAPMLLGAADPIWIDEGRKVLLAGALQPLEGASGDELARRAASLRVFTVDVQSGQIESFAELGPGIKRLSADWDQRSEMLTIHALNASGSMPAMMWKRKRGKWTRVAEASPVNERVQRRSIELTVEQSINDRPVLVATAPETGTRKVVLDPNRWLEEIALGRVEEVRWTAGKGRTIRGLLFYPPGYRAGTRYPLVLQTHGAKPDDFSLDGLVPIFAAQPLAARDMMVLQIDEASIITRNVLQTPAEWPTVQQIVEAAVVYLDDRKLIDRDRVGIVGWSRTGPHSGYTLTHSDYPFAAAMFIDVDDYGWWTYVTRGVHGVIEEAYAAAPFGEGLGVWLEMAPSFNLHRLRTPMLIAQGEDLSAEMWDWFAVLRRLGKPVEMWHMPEGQHIFFKIGERLTVNHLLVDWFDFWLNARESDNPQKASRYLRWREFRIQQERVLSEPRPPLLKWKATR